MPWIKKRSSKKILFGTAEPMDGPVSPVLFGYFKMEHQYDYNPEKAKQLLKEANFDFSKTVNMRTPNGRYLFDKQVSEAVQAYLQAIGVKVELRTYDWPTYVAGLLKPIEETELEVFLLGWGPLVLDADMALYGQFTCEVNPPKGLGSAFYCNPEYDKIMKDSREGAGPAKTAGTSQTGFRDCLGRQPLDVAACGKICHCLLEQDQGDGGDAHRKILSAIHHDAVTETQRPEPGHSAALAPYFASEL